MITKVKDLFVFTTKLINKRTIMTNVRAFNIFGDIPSDLNGAKVIGTHNGNFHCDEALAIALLSLTDEFGQNSIVVRTRNEQVLNRCDLLVDVGAVYDPSRHRYDHHQSTFKDSLNGKYSTRLSSSGLIYKHFGKEIISKYLKEYNQDTKWLDVMYDLMYCNFMEHIDAIDNGIEICDGTPRYKITTTLGNRVSRLNPSWITDSSKRDENGQFKKAVKLTGEEFEEDLKSYLESWLPARAIVKNAVDTALFMDGRILRLDQACPWKEHLFSIEKGTILQVLYVLFPDTSGSWRVQAVPIEGSSFQNRKSLPQEWRGLRDDELSKKAGIDGCIFVHASGFIGGNKTFEGAMKMARKAVELEEEK